MLEETRYKRVYKLNGKLVTKNLVPGFSVYGEELLKEGGKEYREWELERSKLAASIKKGLTFLPLNRGSSVLYLGAASGTTASHVSDIVGREGQVFSIDVAPRVVKNLILCCRKRENMFPLLKNANEPGSYEDLVTKVDFVYQDIASQDQSKILKRNSTFLKSKGYALMMTKASSIDSSIPAEEVFRKVKNRLQGNFRVEDTLKLEPYHKKHKAYLLRKI